MMRRIEKMGLVRMNRLVLTLLFLGSPSVALAAGGETPGLSTLTFPALNFFMYICAAVYLYNRFGRNVLHQRSVEIKDHLRRAAAALGEAEQNFSTLRGDLDDIEQEKTELVRQYNSEGETMSAKIVADAKESAIRTESDVKRQIDAELNQATKKLKKEAVDMAMELARKRLKAELTAEHDRALRKQVVQEALVQKQTQQAEAR